MKKVSTFLILSLFFAVQAFAGPVGLEKAREIAETFWKSNARLNRNVVLQQFGNSAPSKSAAIKGDVKEAAQYYLFTATDNSGFVIVSGDDSMAPIVAYSDNGFTGEMPPALTEWLALYSEYVDDVRAGIVEPVNTTAAAGTRIEPLLKTSWNQSSPYNDYCPVVNGQKTPTGCTATAVAQVMKFHEWPVSPKKAIVWNNNITGNTETIDITKNVYAWDKMLDHYRNGYTAEQADAVARLMIDVGKAIGSSYSPSGTGSNEIAAARGLVNVFDYSPQIKVVRRNECTYDEFISLIRENLEARQPLVHTGQGQSYVAGHAFVCDGIDENNYVHIDWGWDGAYNGFFDLGSMAPGGTGIGGGQDRYNVHQAIIANIRPRATDEAGRPGDPTLYVYDVIDKNNNNTVVDEYTAKFIAGVTDFRVVVQFLNWSHSTVHMSYGLSITSVDGTFSKVSMIDDRSIGLDDGAGFYVDFKVNNANEASVDYLKEGTYYLEIFYKNSDSEPVKMMGENNRLVLEVGKSTAKLSKALPDVSVSGFEFRDAVPNFQNDNVSFDVAFRNNNTNNALVVVVPIINRVSGDKVVSDTLVSAGEVINVYDNTDFLVTYSLGKVLKASGEHYVTFAYDMRNSYVDHEKSVDKSRLRSISGESRRFDIFDLPTGPMPVVTSVTSNNPVYGENLSVAVRILNNSSVSAYSGTIGVFVEKDGVKSLFAQDNVESIKAGSTAVLQYSSKSYIFSLEPGTYEVTVCEMADGKWTDIPSNGSYGFTLQAPTKSMLYVNNVLDFNGGRNCVGRGDSIDVVADITCKFIDFDGFLRMNVSNGVSGVLRSGYIPVSIKDGETLKVNLRSGCADSAPLRQWKVIIMYYDKNKRQLGTVILNDVEYPGNGDFVVQKESTAIDDVNEGAIMVAAGEGCINVVADDAVVTVCTLDGRGIYRGAATAVPVEQGLYVVTVAAPGKVAETIKVFVK